MVTDNRSKECLNFVKVLPDPLPQHLEITGLARRNRFLLRRNMFSSKIHCCYRIISTEHKEKHTFEQDLLFCYVIISSGLKESCSVTLPCPTLCYPMDCNTPGFPIHHLLMELAQTHVHQVGDAIQPSHPLPSTSSPAFSVS